ncbi:MAG: tRNA (adenosine(37)-N6)-threonylcarbamoyltransferase complex dimerization subunit type 1 TsaB [Alphaproteobacteria bacterium]
MCTLVLETTLPAPTIGLVLASGVTDSRVVNTPRPSHLLMPTIVELLAAHHLAPENIQRLVLTTGPGSFTGERVGKAIAEGLKLALDIPVFTLSTPQAIALSCAAHGRFTVLIDSFSTSLYVQHFAADASPLGPIETLLPEAFTLPLSHTPIGNGCARAGVEGLVDIPLDMAKIVAFATA